MHRDQLDDMFRRLAYLTGAAQQKSGDQTSWSYTLADGTTERVVIRGLRAEEHIRFDVETLVVWVWSAVDHLKARAATLGQHPDLVWNVIAADDRMIVCKDLANSLKHGGRSKNLRRLALGRVRVVCPGEALQYMLVLPGDATIEFGLADSDAADITFPVIDDHGTEIDEALALTEHAVEMLERVSAQLSSLD